MELIDVKKMSLSCFSDQLWIVVCISQGFMYQNNFMLSSHRLKFFFCSVNISGFSTSVWFPLQAAVYSQLRHWFLTSMSSFTTVSTCLKSHRHLNESCWYHRGDPSSRGTSDLFLPARWWSSWPTTIIATITEGTWKHQTDTLHLDLLHGPGPVISYYLEGLKLICRYRFRSERLFIQNQWNYSEINNRLTAHAL